MELCDGNVLNLFVKSHEKLIDTGPPSNMKLRLKAISEIAEGLSYIHECGIIHFDVKTANILYVRSAENKFNFKITDFGVNMQCQLYTFFHRVCHVVFSSSRH